MRQYLPNSAEAIARLLAMFVITDGNVDPREIDLLERLHVYDMLGIGRKQFTQVLVDYCDDISDEAEHDGTIRLLDKERVEELLGDVTDHKKRLLTCVLAMDISKADGDISDSEIALLRFMMQRWNISLDDLHHTFTR